MEKIKYMEKENCVLAVLPVSQAEEAKILWNMVEHNQIEGICPFQYFYLNEEVCFRYDMAKYRMLVNCLDKQEVGYDVIYPLCREILRVLDRGCDFLLEEKDYLLSPEWIFWDSYQKKVSLCYLPGRKQTPKREFLCLVEYLLQHVCHQDRMAVEFIYGLYDLAVSEETPFEVLKDYVIQNQWQEDGEKFQEDGKTFQEDGKPFQKNGLRWQKAVKSFQKDDKPFQEKDSLPWQKNEKNLGFQKKQSVEGGLLKWKKRDKREKDEKLAQERKIIRIGRDASNDVCIPVTTVSRKHFQIIFEGRDMYLVDLSSKNGTRVNGRKIRAMEKKRIKEGDRVCAGGFSCLVQQIIKPLPGKMPESGGDGSTGSVISFE